MLRIPSVVDDEVQGDDVHDGEHDQRRAAAGGPAPQPGSNGRAGRSGRENRRRLALRELDDRHHSAPGMWKAARMPPAVPTATAAHSIARSRETAIPLPTSATRIPFSPV